MKLYDTFNTLTALIILTFLGSAQASTFTGNIIQLRINTDDGGVARVSIKTRDHGGHCVNSEWYAYQPADREVGKLWTDALIAAHMNNRRVFITGSERCDRFDVEGVTDIDFK